MVVRDCFRPKMLLIQLPMHPPFVSIWKESCQRCPAHSRGRYQFLNAANSKSWTTYSLKMGSCVRSEYIFARRSSSSSASLNLFNITKCFPNDEAWRMGHYSQFGKSGNSSKMTHFDNFCPMRGRSGGLYSWENQTYSRRKFSVWGLEDMAVTCDTRLCRIFWRKTQSGRRPVDRIRCECRQ